MFPRRRMPESRCFGQKLLFDVSSFDINIVSLKRGRRGRGINYRIRTCIKIRRLCPSLIILVFDEQSSSSVFKWDFRVKRRNVYESEKSGFFRSRTIDGSRLSDSSNETGYSEASAFACTRSWMMSSRMELEFGWNVKKIVHDFCLSFSPLRSHSLPLSPALSFSLARAILTLPNVCTCTCVFMCVRDSIYIYNIYIFFSILYIYIYILCIFI